MTSQKDCLLKAQVYRRVPVAAGGKSLNGYSDYVRFYANNLVWFVHIRFFFFLVRSERAGLDRSTTASAERAKNKKPFFVIFIVFAHRNNTLFVFDEIFYKKID